MRWSNEQLVEELKVLARKDREQCIEIIVRLSEMDQRRLYAGLGFASLWEFCRQVLFFSESVAGKRIAVTRAVRKVPMMIELLRTGELSVCSAAMLAPYLDGQDAEQLVLEAAGKSKRQLADMLSVRKGYRRKTPELIRRIVADVDRPEPELAFGGEELQLEREVVEAVKTHHVSFHARAQLVDNLARLKELLGGKELDEVLLRATEALLEKVDPVRRHQRRERRKAAKADKAATADAKAPAPDGESSGKPVTIKSVIAPRRFSRADQDAGYVRDGGQCTFEHLGRRCTARVFLQNDHQRPFALGGASHLMNHRLLCPAHNRLHARWTFGDVPFGDATQKHAAASRQATPRCFRG
jgi:hypothetical protein